MILPASLALMTLAALGFLAPVPTLLRVDEQSGEQALADLCALPGVQLEVQTRSNMLSTGTRDALRRCHAPIVELRLPLKRAQIEQLERVPGAEVAFDLAPGGELPWQALSRLGPRRIHVRVPMPLDDARARAIERLRHAEVAFDLRGRLPSAGELARIRALDRADRTLRIDARAPPELALALQAVEPHQLVVETAGNALPPALLAALVQAGLPTRAALAWPLDERDLAPLAEIRRLSLEIELGTLEELPRGLRPALQALGPSDQPLVQPDGGLEPLRLLPASSLTPRARLR